MKASLNHIFRSIWSDALNTWVAVSEITSAKGKRSKSCALSAAELADNNSESGNFAKRNNRLRIKPLALVLACCFSLQAQANPTGAQVVSGSASISQHGNLLTVTNSPNAVINWQGFSIGTGQTTNFIQQSASSSVLNRVVGPDPSTLLGTLTSNGRVFLINPAGILVGQGARIDVGGLITSTLNLSNADFLAGKLNFTANSNAGTIQNNGTITTPEGGSVYLVAPQVDNYGVINTPKGETILAAGSTVQIVDSGAPGVTVQITGSSNTATNLGKILADSGQIGVVGAVVKNSGTISANSLVSQGGKIFLKATNSVEAGGTITANGSKGGAVEVLGNEVKVADGAIVSANGTQSGGSVLVGGDYQGKNPDIQNARNTYVAPTATLSANAMQSGDGGKLIVWSDNNTQVYGSVSATGGANGGNGGFIETSGHYLDVTNAADASAPKGVAGTWLLDPNNITITSGVDSSISANSTTGLITYSTTNDSSILTNTTIQAALNAGTNVNVTTAAQGTNLQLGDIAVNAAIAKTAGASATLTLNAGNNIVINAPITSTVGALNLLLNYGNAGSATLASNLGLLGGTLNVQKAGVAGVGMLQSNSGTLSSVVIGSNLTINGSMNINNGITFGNGVTVNKDGGTWYFGTTGLQHIAVQSGTATLNDAGGTLYAGYTSGGSLQIDSGVTVQGYGTIYDYNATSLTNNGSIIANTVGQTLYVSDYYVTSAVINNGTMSATAGTLTISPTTFTNASGATVTASAGTTLNITPNTLSNAGTITLGGMAATIGKSYSSTYTGLTNTGGIALNSGTLNLNISATTAGLNTNLGTMFSTRATGTVLNFGGALTNTGSTLDIGGNGLFGTGGLSSLSGTITGGTIISSDATPLAGPSTPTLSGVTLGDGTHNALVMSGSYNIMNGLSLYSGLTLNLGNSRLYFYGNLNNTSSVQNLSVTGGANPTATVQMGGGYIYTYDYSTAGTETLTLGTGLTIQGYGHIADDSYSQNLINNGTIISNAATQTFTINPNVFTNNGTMSATAGTLTISPITFTNASGATVTANAGTTLNITPHTLSNAGTVTLGGTVATIGANYWNGSVYTYTGLTNTGGIALNSGTLNLNISATTAGLNTNLGTMFSTRATGTVLNFGGALTNTGSTLDIGGSGLFGAGGLSSLSGTITGGTIISSDATPLTGSSTPTLSGVTLGDGTHNALAMSGSYNIMNGLSLYSGLTLNLGNSNLYFYGNLNNTSSVQNLSVTGGANPTATVQMGGGYIYTYDYSTAGTETLTLGTGLTIQGYGHIADDSYSQNLINNGTIIGNAATQTFTINPNVFTNNGTMSATAGTLTISPITFTNASGATVTANAGTTLNITPHTLSNAGTVTLGGTVATIGANYWNGSVYTYTGLTNTGGIALNSGTLNLNISATTAGLNTNLGTMFSTRATGTVLNFGGALTNTGSTLDIGGSGLFGAGGLSSLSGTITGGTIISSDATPLTGSSTPTLSGVTLGDGTHNALAMSGSYNIMNGLSLYSGLTLNLGNSNLYFYGNLNNTSSVQNLSVTGGANPTATVQMGGGYIYTYDYSTAGTETLTLGTGLTIQGYGHIADDYYSQNLVNNGTINGNFSINSNSVTNNGTLAGTGTITIGGGTGTLTNNGVISPGITGGDTTGTLTINGNLLMASGSGLNVEIDSPLAGDYSVLNVSKAATLTGGTLNLSGWSGSGSYAAVNATNGLGGTTFSSINSGTFTQVPAYSSNSLTLAVTANSNTSTIYWKGGTDSNWATAANWSNNLTPTYTENLYIGSGAGTVTVSSVGQAGNTLVCNANFNLSTGGALLLTGASIFRGATNISDGTLTGTGSITIASGGSLSWSGGTINGSVPSSLVTQTGSTSTVTAGTLGAYLNWHNSGTLNLAPATWTNAGGLNQTAGILNLSGTFTAANLGNFTRTGGTVNLNGTFTNTSTLDIGSGGLFGTGGLSSLSGTITGGTLTSGDGTPLTTSYGTLSGVTIGSNLTVTGNNYLYVNNNLTLGNGVVLNVGSNYLYFGNTTSTDHIATTTGSATVNLAGGALYGGYNSQPLQIDSGVTVQGYGEIYNYYGTTVTNAGTIIANTVGQTLTINPSIFTNSGTLSTAAGTLTITPTTFTNASGGNVTASAGTTLNITPDTLSNAGTITLGGVAATIGVGYSGTYTGLTNTGSIALNSGTLNLNISGTTTGLNTNLGAMFSNRATGTVLNFGGVLTNTGSTLNIGSAGLFGAGGLSSLSGTITGGTLTSGDGTPLTTSYGTLSGVTIGSNLTVAGNNYLYVNNNLTLGNGVVLNVGSNYLYFGNTTSTDHIATTTGSATVNLAGGALYGGYNSQPLQIDSGVTVQGYGEIYNYYGTTVTNAGMIIANTVGQTLTINPSIFTNSGTLSTTAGTLTITPTTFTNASGGNITASAGTTLNITPDTLSNAGTITLGGVAATIGTSYWNGSVYTYTGLTNTGSIALNSGTLNLNISGTTAGLNTNLGTMFSTRVAGTTLNFGGLLTNTGSTLDIGSGGLFGTGGLSSLSGTITGGTLTSGDGTPLTTSYGTLNGVTIGSNLTVAGNNYLYVNNNLTLGNGVVLNTGTNYLYFGNTTSTDHIATTTGTATVNMSGGALYGGYNSQSLQIDSGVTVQGYGNIYNYYGISVTNAGTIIASTVGQTLLIDPSTFTNIGTMGATAGTLNVNPYSSTAPSWSNTGTMQISGGTLSLGGSFTTAGIGAITRTGGLVNITGKLDNTANTGTLDIGSAGVFGTGGLSSLSGTITGGTLISSDKTPLTTSYGTLNGVTIGSSLTVAGNNYLYIYNNLTLGNGVALNTGTNYLYFGNTTSADHISTTTGTATVNLAGGTLYGGYNSEPLQIDSGLTVQGYGEIYNYYGTTVTNAGTIIANTYGQTLLIDPSAFTNNGTMNATAGTMSVSATNFTQSGTINLASGGTFSRSSGFTNSSTGVIQGSGYINLSSTGTLINQGAINPGGSGIGQLNITGNLTNTTGSINLDIGGLVPSTQHDKLMVSGTATLGGNLNVNNVTSFTPGATDAFNVLGAGTISGTFGAVNTPAGSAYATQYNTKTAWLSLSSSASPSPINAWFADGNGNWNVAANWTNQAVPTATDTVIIDRPNGVYNVMVTSGTLLAGSLLSNENLLISGGSLTVSAASTLNGNTVVNGGTVNLTGGVTNNGTLSGSGTINVGSGLNNLGSINPGTAGAAGTLNINGNAVLGTSSILNIRLGGTGTGQSDLLAVTGNVTLGGTLNATLLSGYTPVNADSIPFVTMSGTASGTFATNNLPTGFSTGYGLAAGDAANLIYSSGGITDTFTNGSGTLDWDTAGNWSSGVLPGSADSALIVTGSGYAVTHATSAADTISALTISSGNSLNISNGSLTVLGSTTLGGGLTVSGTGSTALNGGVNGGTSGLISVLAGSLSLGATSTLNNLALSGGLLTGTGSLTLSGTATQTEGTLQLNTFNVNSGATYNISNATSPTATNPFFMPTTFNNSGVVNWNGTAQQRTPGGSSTFNNLSGGQFNILNNVIWDTCCSGGAITFNNQSGAIITKSSTGTSSFTQNIAFNNYGTLNVAAGVLNIAGTAGGTQSGMINIATGATLTRSVGFTNHGTLSGTGTITVGTGTAGLFNAGYITPGSAGVAGILNVTGDLQLSSGSVLNIKMGGTGTGQSDMVAVTGNVLLGGTLNATLIGSYVPNNADAIPFVTMGGTSSGNFIYKSLPTGFNASYGTATGVAASLIYAPGITDTFTNANGNLDWDTAGNWSSNSVPGASDSALIINGTGFAVTHATTAVDTVSTLSISSANSLNVSAGSLTVTGTTTLGGGVTVSGGSLTLGGILNGTTTGVGNVGASSFSMSGGQLYAPTTMSLGSYTQSGGTLNLPTTFNLQSGSTVNVSGGSISSSTSLVNISAGGIVTVGVPFSANAFTLGGGTWSQVATTLPSFTVNNFSIAGGTFIRALGGDGSTVAPYQLTDIYGVQGMGSMGGLGKAYVLANNIDASGTASWNAGAGFAPVGANSSTPFTGTFDGQSHNISNLTISLPTTNFVGLFGYTGTSSSISNVGLVAGNVIGNWSVGDLVGVNSGTITNSYATGGVTAGNSSGSNGGAGGLVGYNLGTISNSYAAVNVQGGNGSYSNGGIGGLAGDNGGTISGSYATGNVTGGNGSYNNFGGGGLVGYNDGGTISNSYATGSVSGLVNAAEAGLVGGNGGSISNSYATGKVSGNSDVGGLVGYNFNGGTVSNSFWDTDTSGRKTDGASSGSIGLTTLAMMDANTNPITAGSWGASTWGIVAGVSTPYLMWRFPTAPQVVSGTLVGNTGGSIIQTVQNGNELATVSTGADGSFLQMLDAGSIPSGHTLLAVVSNNSGGISSSVNIPTAAMRLSDGSNLTGINLAPSALTISSNSATAISNADLIAAVGSLDTSGHFTVGSGNNITLTGVAFVTAPATSYLLNGNLAADGGLVLNGPVTMANDATLTASGTSNITFNGTVSGSAYSLTLNAGGSISSLLSSGQTDISAGTVVIAAGTGIGSADVPLKLVTSSLSATTNAGGINIANNPTAAVILGSLTTGDASAVTYSQNGQDLTITGFVSSNGGSVLIDPPANLTMSSTAQVSSGGGTIAVQASGNVALAKIDAGSSGAISLTAGGNVSSTPGFNGANLVGGTATLTAGGSASLKTTIPTDQINTSGVKGGADITPTDSSGNPTVNGNTSSTVNSLINQNSTLVTTPVSVQQAVTPSTSDTTSSANGASNLQNALSQTQTIGGTTPDSFAASEGVSGSGNEGGNAGDKDKDKDKNNTGTSKGGSDKNNSKDKQNAKPNKC